MILTKSKPTYSELNTIVAAFCKWLTRNYTDLLDNCFIFLEPCDDGSWHVHFLIAMIDKPLTFDDEVKIKEWWARKNTKPCDDQVQFAEPFESVDDLLRVLDYLNPTSKKKRHRIKNYPQSCQPMRHIGNVVEPNKALTKFEIAKTILREEKTERRNAIEIEQTNTGVLLYSCKEYLFVAAQNLLKATQAEVVNDNTHETPSGEKEVISDNGKTDWFACKHNDGKCKCDKCDRQKTCDKRNRCEEHCIGFDTSFCRGCVWNTEGG